jgi:hypothetical protein
LSSYEYAIALYRFGRTQEALAVVDKQRGHVDNDLMQCLLLAELDGRTDRALALCRELASHDLQDREFLHCQCMLRILGAKEETIRACRKRAAQQADEKQAPWAPFSLVPGRRFIEYFAGLVDEDQLLTAAADSLWDKCNAEFFIAATKLSDGRRSEAHDHFRRCNATRAITVMLYHVCDSILARIAEDPSWPKWAPSDK